MQLNLNLSTIANLPVTRTISQTFQSLRSWKVLVISTTTGLLAGLGAAYFLHDTPSTTPSISTPSIDHPPLQQRAIITFSSPPEPYRISPAASFSKVDFPIIAIITTICLSALGLFFFSKERTIPKKEENQSTNTIQLANESNQTQLAKANEETIPNEEENQSTETIQLANESNQAQLEEANRQAPIAKEDNQNQPVKTGIQPKKQNQYKNKLLGKFANNFEETLRNEATVIQNILIKIKTIQERDFPGILEKSVRVINSLEQKYPGERNKNIRNQWCQLFLMAMAIRCCMREYLLEKILKLTNQFKHSKKTKMFLEKINENLKKAMSCIRLPESVIKFNELDIVTIQKKAQKLFFEKDNKIEEYLIKLINTEFEDDDNLKKEIEKVQACSPMDYEKLYILLKG